MEATISEKTVKIPVGNVSLSGDLSIPDEAAGIVIFSHGSGSSRHSERNRYVAGELQSKGFATLLFDLLTEEEDQDFENHFDIALLSERLEKVTKWVRQQAGTKNLPIGYFGGSTGAAAALRAAATLSGIVRTVVSRGGRPDLAMELLVEVKAPTLLIVGSVDEDVLHLNRQALRHLAGERKLAIVEGATHLFSEPGTLEEVAALTANWFEKYLTGK